MHLRLINELNINGIGRIQYSVSIADMNHFLPTGFATRSQKKTLKLATRVGIISACAIKFTTCILCVNSMQWDVDSAFEFSYGFFSTQELATNCRKSKCWDTIAGQSGELDGVSCKKLIKKINNVINPSPQFHSTIEICWLFYIIYSYQLWQFGGITLHCATIDYSLVFPF